MLLLATYIKSFAILAELCVLLGPRICHYFKFKILWYNSTMKICFRQVAQRFSGFIFFLWNRKLIGHFFCAPKGKQNKSVKKFATIWKWLQQVLLQNMSAHVVSPWFVDKTLGRGYQLNEDRYWGHFSAKLLESQDLLDNVTSFIMHHILYIFTYMFLNLLPWELC